MYVFGARNTAIGTASTARHNGTSHSHRRRIAMARALAKRRGSDSIVHLLAGRSGVTETLAAPVASETAWRAVAGTDLLRIFSTITDIPTSR